MNRGVLVPIGPGVSTLCAAFLYFDLSFAIWVLFGALGNFVAADFRLQPWQKGFLVAVPVLAGSGFRLLFGWAETRFGGKRAALAGATLTLLPLFWGWIGARQAWELVAIGILLGVAGASFAVALPMVSRWFSADKQGLVLGMAGAGNSGTLLATLFGPYLASRFGWHSAFGLALFPMLLSCLILLILAKDAARTDPSRSGAGEFREFFRQVDAWVFSFLYSVTFGGFIGLTTFLGIFFFDQYQTDKCTAAFLQTLVLAAGSWLRPMGGYLADRLGGMRVLCGLFGIAASCCFAAASFPPLAAEVAVFAVLLGSLGMGNGAVFQLVGVRMGSRIGLATGLIGASGGLGGFLLPICLGSLKSIAGSYGLGFLLYGTALVVSAAASASGIALLGKGSPLLILRPNRGRSL